MEMKSINDLLKLGYSLKQEGDTTWLIGLFDEKVVGFDRDVDLEEKNYTINNDDEITAIFL
jgi:hypothetical protein